MGIASWLQSLFSRREKSLSRYRRGMHKAKLGDFSGAVEDYSAVIDTGGVADDVLGMALYNRALAYSSLQQAEKAAEDLTRVLGMPGLPESIKVAANQRRERIRRREA